MHMYHIQCDIYSIGNSYSPSATAFEYYEEADPSATVNDEDVGCVVLYQRELYKETDPFNAGSNVEVQDNHQFEQGMEKNFKKRVIDVKMVLICRAGKETKCMQSPYISSRLGVYSRGLLFWQILLHWSTSCCQIILLYYCQ